jgi:hypothetical protein
MPHEGAGGKYKPPRDTESRGGQGDAVYRGPAGGAKGRGSPGRSNPPATNKGPAEVVWEGGTRHRGNSAGLYKGRRQVAREGGDRSPGDPLPPAFPVHFFFACQTFSFTSTV